MPEDSTPEKKAGPASSSSSSPAARRTPGRGAGGRAAAPAGKGLGGKGVGGKGAGARGSTGKGRTRPPTAVVAPSKPWGLIAGAVVVVVFAAAVIGYAVYAVNRSNADRITAADQIAGVQAFDYAAGQEHVTTDVSYDQSPPVGGPHDPYWADCTGTVYDIDIRHENAVHGLEHGAVWITYDPARINGADLDTLKQVVDGNSGLMLSPYAGLSSPVSLQSWNHQLFLDSVTDPRLQQYVDFFTFGTDADGTSLYPEVGASCENPQFAADPLPADASSAPIGASDAPTTDSVAPTGEPTASAAP